VSEVSVSLKLLHNSNKKLVQTNAMLVVKASLTLSFLYQHRRSQGVGAKWAMAPTEFLENMVILCFERVFSKQNSVIRLKPNVSPQNFWAGYATVYQYQYVSGIKSETIDSASPDIRLMFWI